MKKIAKIFKNAEATIDQLELTDEDLAKTDESQNDFGGDTIEYAPMTTDVGEGGAIFELQELKNSFVETRRGLQTLLLNGQRLMNQTSTLQLASMTASQVEAIAALSNTVSTQLNLMITLYKTIAEIEQLRMPKNASIGNVGDNANITNQTIFVGDTSQLLEAINNKKDNYENKI